MSEVFSLIHRPSGQIVATVRRADGWWAKGWGVLGWRSLPPGQGLWLPGVSAVHTLFVRFPLDLLFLDADLTTLRTVPNVPAWTPLVRARGAHHTVELGAGTLVLAGIAARMGEQWELGAL
ncbi:MAG: DUF192 domain-containing protein [Armatimonadetes bacterium]|nr:DUF192 domain-containing protein [Armatimonadota bacterium]